MKVGYYPGCSLEATARSYDMSVRDICRELDIGLEEIPEWICCGSTPVLKTNGLLSAALGAHNLALTEAQKISQLVIPCPFCFRRLLSAKEELQQNESLKEKVREAIEAESGDCVEVHNILGFLRYTVGLDVIRSHVRKPLNGLKVLPYYGCYLVKPAGVTHYDDPENPVSMDELLEALGAEVLKWDFKTECCGASLTISKTDKVCELSGRILREAAYKKADALVVACQVCQANLDLRQDEISKRHGVAYNIPVIYFTQLMGLSFDIPYRSLGIRRHMKDPQAMLRSKGIIE